MEGTEEIVVDQSSESQLAWFVVPGIPKGKERHRSRVSKNSAGKAFVQSYAPEETVEYENLVRLAAHGAMKGRAPHLGPVEVLISSFYPIPKSWSKKRQQMAIDGAIRPTVKPDTDNVEKAILDGINAIVVRDDAQVCDNRHRKFYGPSPRVMVIVMKINAEPAY